MTNVTIAALQLSALPGRVEENLDRWEAAVDALPVGVDLAVAPELYNTGYDLDLLAARGRELAEPLGGPTLGRLAAVARRRHMTLVMGFLEREDDSIYDSVAVAGPDESALAVYRKTHLYPAEQAVFSRGDELVVARGGGLRLGLMICFEHAFPELATTLALRGSDLFLIPSAVPVGYDHVLSLRTRARAQDNQVFAIGCNMAAPFCGRSLIVDPRGETLAVAGVGEETLIATLDLEEATRERAREPSLRLRRPELYR